MLLKELHSDQRRQLNETQQVFEAWRAASWEARHHFAGSMRWAERKGIAYLLRKVGRTERSLGRRSDETERVHDDFMTGRVTNRDRIRRLAGRLDELAPVNRVMSLGRVPLIAARILRECDKAGLLGKHLVIVGPNVLFACEAAAGVQVENGIGASGGGGDPLGDARRRLCLALADVHARGLMGLLRTVDTSFAPVRSGSFRAANRYGYLVDLIRPEAGDAMRGRPRQALADLPEDLQGAAAFGLGWLVNAPRMDVIAIDERGYPVRMTVIDPRAFALQMAWVSAREDREPAKARRDFEQAKAAAIIATRYLRRPFDDPGLSALPSSLSALAPTIAGAVTDEAMGEGERTPA